MKKTFKALKHTLALLLLSLVFIGCDKDFSAIQSNVLGEDNFNFNATNASYPVIAYNKKLDSLQTNGLSSYMLGFYNDPAYGKTTASIVAQVTPATTNPNFGENAEIESVILSIPYFSTQIGIETDGKPVYRLDSLYVAGNDPENAGKIKLSVYQNNYFLRDFNPNSTESTTQNYYSKANGNPNSTDNFAVIESGIINFEDHKGQLLYENSDFIPSSEPIATVTGTGETAITLYAAPVLRINLAETMDGKAFWKSLILDKSGSEELSNASNFRNYFRGLYIKVEALGETGSMVLLDFKDNNVDPQNAEARIDLNYTNDATADGNVDTYSMNLSGSKRLNTFINEFDKVTLENGDKTMGDKNLHLKGTAGSMAVLELFNGFVDCDGDGQVNDKAIDCFKNTFRKTDEDGNYIKENGDFLLKRLINEAQLIVYEDEIMSSFGNDHSAHNRLYLYDLKNNIPTIDYLLDLTENQSNPLNSRILSLGQRVNDEDKGTAKYKLRITEHLNNILIRDSTNVKLGLVLSTNVNLTNPIDILNSNGTVTRVPSTTVLAPKGTILYGSGENAPEGKKIQLELFLTEPTAR